jgi:hypothetical protein
MAKKNIPNIKTPAVTNGNSLDCAYKNEAIKGPTTLDRDERLCKVPNIVPWA